MKKKAKMKLKAFFFLHIRKKVYDTMNLINPTKL